MLFGGGESLDGPAWVSVSKYMRGCRTGGGDAEREGKGPLLEALASKFLGTGRGGGGRAVADDLGMAMAAAR
jgi:hypothetical protein